MNIKHVACQLQVKALAADGVFTGYASVFGIVDQQNEIVAKGAFARTLSSWQRQGRAPAMLWMRVTSIASGRLSSGRIEGRRWASIVLPVPGEPLSRQL